MAVEKVNGVESQKYMLQCYSVATTSVKISVKQCMRFKLNLYFFSFFSVLLKDDFMFLFLLQLTAHVCT